MFLSNSTYLDLYSKTVVSYKDIDLSLRAYLEGSGEQKKNSFFDKFNFELAIDYDKTLKGHIITVEAPDKMIFFKRKGIEEPVPYELESLGNWTLLHLLPACFYCIGHGGMLLLDEFSSGFHNELEELLVRDFDSEGSVIKRFSSEKPREAQNMEKMYLGGVFNGVPKYEYTIK